MPVDAAVQEFDAATNTDKARKLTADLSHTEAERLRLARQCEAVKVRAHHAPVALSTWFRNYAIMACSSASEKLSHNITATLHIKAHGGLAAQTRLKRLEQERREAEAAEKEREAEHMRLKLVIAEAEKVSGAICIIYR